MQPSLNCSYRPAKFTRDFIIRPALFMKHLKGLAIFGSQRGQRGGEFPPKLTGIIFLAGRQSLRQVIDRFRPPTAFANISSTTIYRNPENPRL
jgi:hypothetical protein